MYKFFERAILQGETEVLVDTGRCAKTIIRHASPAGELPKFPAYLSTTVFGRALKSTVNSVDEAPEDDAKDGLLPILVIVDEKCGCFTGVVAKGVTPYAIGLVTEALGFADAKWSS